MAKESKEEGLITQSAADDLAAYRDQFDYKEDVKQVVDARIPKISIVRESRQFRFDDDSFQQSFESVAVGFFRTRSFWNAGMEEAGGETTRPDCFSVDGVKPSENSTEKQHDVCATCPMNKFGSGKNNSKKCKERGHLLLLDPKAAIPFPAELSLPVTSIGTVNDFLLKAGKDARPLVSYLIKFSLEKERTKSGFENAVLKMEGIGVTPGKLAPIIKELKDNMATFKARIAGGAPEEAVVAEDGAAAETAPPF